MVRTGPYRVLRHPSYTGLLVATLGIALLLGNFHSYDVIHVAAAWLLYLLLKTATRLAQRPKSVVFAAVE